VDLHLHDTVCVVTGSTGGIGLEVALLLAAEGAPVVTTGRATTAPGVGETLHVPADLAERGEAERLVREVEQRLGRVDVLVNNVGDFHPLVRFAKSTPESWDAMYQINLRHFFSVTRAFLQPMIDSGGGSIVNFHSVEGMRGYPGEQASKQLFAQPLALTIWPHMQLSQLKAIVHP